MEKSQEEKHEIRKSKWREYHQKNKDKRNQQSREYKEQNKEQIKEYLAKTKDERNQKNKIYREKNKEHIKAYLEKNKEHIKQRSKEYREKNIDKTKEKAYAAKLCEVCNISVMSKNFSRHCKSEEHKAKMNKPEPPFGSQYITYDDSDDDACLSCGLAESCMCASRYNNFIRYSTSDGNCCDCPPGFKGLGMNCPIH